VRARSSKPPESKEPPRGKVIAKWTLRTQLDGVTKMSTNRRRNAMAKLPRKIVTTLGDLIAAAYDAAGGFGPQREERAAVLLTASPLARRLNKQLQFTR
jgi:hypothetical protein